MEIKQYIQIVRHWAWLLALGLALGAAAAFGFSLTQARIFSATTRVQIMSAPGATQSGNTYFTDTQLANTYVQTIKTKPILDEVRRQLGASLEPEDISARIIGETQLIDITVENGDPQMAADIANTLVEVFVVKNNELQSRRFNESEQSLQTQIASIDSQIEALQRQSTSLNSTETKASIAKVENELGKLQSEIGTLETEIYDIEHPEGTSSWANPTVVPEQKPVLAEKRLRLDQLNASLELYKQVYTNLTVLGTDPSGTVDTTEKDRIESSIGLYEQIRANLLSSYEGVRLARLNSTSNVVQIEPALADPEPIRPLIPRNVGMGAAIGLLLAAGIIFAIEYLDDTLKTSEQITETLGLPVIGYVGDMEAIEEKLYVEALPRSPIAESFRSLRTNLEFSAVDRPIQTLLVVSANPNEGKSTISCNLAMTYAQAGKKVLLIDADMRKPTVHRFFGLNNRVGLSDIFRNKATIAEVKNVYKQSNLAVLTSGGIPHNPVDLLSSNKMQLTLEEAKRLADIVVVDSPPFLVSDASVLASRVDGVLMVINPGKTQVDSALFSLEQMKRAGANILGVVLNRHSRHQSYYYRYYRYNNHYYDGYYSSYYGGSTRRRHEKTQFSQWLGGLNRAKKDEKESDNEA